MVAILKAAGVTILVGGALVAAFYLAYIFVLLAALFGIGSIAYAVFKSK